jgi:hypothetical protein
MKHLVVTVHGIRTFGGWQERLERLLNEESGSRHLNAINYKFGYFSVLAFLIPVFRWLTVRRFRRFLLEIVASESWDRIDIVAHSFGTHIVAWALYGIAPKDRPRIDTLIFAGSVLKSNFPWQVMIGHGVGRVINDCGSKDVVLLVNQLTVLFTGMAGRLGFNGGISRTLRNRYFNFGHSDYFLTNKRPDDTFMRRHWVPLLTTDGETELVDMRETSALTGIKLTLLNNAEPIKIAVYAAPFVAIALVFRSLYLTAERETLRATKQAALSDARAELIESQLSLNDAPQKALRGAYQSAQTLDRLGAGDGALALLSSILNTARELPLHVPYSHYSLDKVTVLARQSAPKGSTDGAISGRPATKPLMVVGSKDVTGIIDDDDHHRLAFRDHVEVCRGNREFDPNHGKIGDGIEISRISLAPDQ